jgi:predicted methyltransferase
MRSHLAIGLALIVVACGGGAASMSPAATPTAAFTPASTPAAGPTPAPPAATPLSADAIKAIVAASDRTEHDKTLDASRHPAELLAFLGVGPGMTVADLGAGGGYTTELLARAVGPSGKVYGQNDPSLLKRFIEKIWAERLALPADKAVIRSDRPFDDPLPPDAKNLDLVVNYIFYHDTVWLGAARDKMNKAVFDALRPGGAYVIVDASAQDGHGVADAKTLHRIEQSTVENEVAQAGFTLAAKGDFLRNPNDKRDWSSSPGEAGARRGTEDRFVLKFVKPDHEEVRAMHTQRAYTEGPVTEVTYMSIEYGHFEEYIDWLNSTWKPTMEATKKAGLIVGYKAFRLTPKSPEQPNICFMITFENMAALDRGVELEAVAEKVIGSTEVQNKARVGRNGYRRVLGSELMRELVLR